MSEKCQTQFINGENTLTCGKDPGRHVMHRDDRTGDRFVRVGRGAFIVEHSAAGNDSNA